MKKDFSRPRIVIASPTRNLDGALGRDPYLASNDRDHMQISPGPAPALDFPGALAKARQRAEPRMRQYGLNMITNTLDDPHQLKTNNEVAKASLKKRLQPSAYPGPGNYDPQKVPDIGHLPSNNSTSVENAAMLRKGHDKNLFSKLGINDNDMISKKGAAFNSTAPRFQSESTRNIHRRAATINGDESQMNVYHLQMLEGP